MATELPNQYPGAGLPLRWYPQGGSQSEVRFPIGAHHNCWGSDSELLTIREVAMMAVMDTLTDKPNWQEKVFDDDIVAKWRQEAMAQPEDDLYKRITEHLKPFVSLYESRRHRPDKGRKPICRILSEQAFDYCISELRAKVDLFKATGLVHTLDSVSAGLVKSDNIVPEQLHKDLRASFDTLIKDQSASVDWHPHSNDMVQDLVHPSMYPFIYGQSGFMPDEVVGVSNAVDSWTGLGEPVPRDPGSSSAPQRRGFAGVFGEGIGGSVVPPNYWSTTYQWLPANLAFQDDGSVKFTSYINNLHPKKYPEIYKTIEKLVDISIPAWNHCLVGRDTDPAGVKRKSPRIPLPNSADDDDEELWEPKEHSLARCNIDLTDEMVLEIADYLGLEADDESDDESPEEERDLEEDSGERARDARRILNSNLEEFEEWKWKQCREILIPEPEEFSKDDYDYSMAQNLKEKFRDTGLQVIVKLATIELTPEKPEFPAGGWHIEGMMNEQICATALYYLDSENVTPSHLSFRMQTSYYQDDLQDKVGQDAYSWLEQVHGTSLGPSGGIEAPCIQYYGNIETRQGRLLAFPNTFQHCVSSFKLQDPTKPGHRRFIALWLVDPHRRIISTANVPPQQLDWWVEAVFGGDAQTAHGNIPPEILQLIMEKKGIADRFPDEKGANIHSRLPNEIMNMIREHGVMPEGLIDVEQAKEHRLKFMEERGRFHETSKQGWQSVSYSFCEH